MNEDPYLNLAEYIGSHQFITVDNSLLTLVRKYSRIQNYNSLYRVWYGVYIERAFKDFRSERSHKVGASHSYSSSFAAIKEIDKVLDYGDTVIVTVHNGLQGFDPIQVLQRGLEDGLAGELEEDIEYIKHIIKENLYQKEVFVLNPITEIEQDDIYTILNDDKKEYNLEEKSMRKEILEVTQEAKINSDIILEVGDRVQVLSLSEARSIRIQPKDWMRMMDLILAGKDGANVARAIKDKEKAIARYVAGIKIDPRGHFDAFYDKAIELGSTKEEIDLIVADTTIPEDINNKYISLKNKKLNNSFVGAISKEVLKLGFDINYLPYNGYALTFEGKEAMNRNGRKWTIGYKTEIELEDRKISFIFDAITDEGGSTTYYSIFSIDTENVNSRVMGQREFLTWLKDKLNTY